MEHQTLKELLFKTYATLGMAIAAVKNEENEYSKLSWAIRQRNFKTLMEGTAQVQSIFKDERRKMTHSECCCYCGKTGALTLDHVIASKRGGPDTGDNFVYACARCNSAKGAADLLTWFAQRNTFPPLYVFQRYMKLVIRYSEENDLMNESTQTLAEKELPFDLSSFPTRFPPPSELVLTVPMLEEKTETPEPLKGRTFVFTGELFGLKRSEAIQLVQKLGAETRSAVSSTVTHLVVGQNLWQKTEAGNKPTNKIANALRLQEQEHPIQIWPEVVFLTTLLKAQPTVSRVLEEYREFRSS